MEEINHKFLMFSIYLLYSLGYFVEESNLALSSQYFAFT